MISKESYDFEYLNRINEHYPLYSESEKKIADYFLKNRQSDKAKKVAEMSAVELAAATGTSTATIIRFCRAVGFKGWTELKYYINKGNLSHSHKNRPVHANDTISTVRQKIGNLNKAVLDDTMTLLDDNSLTLAVEKIANAGQVFMMAEGGSGCTGRLAELMFMQIGINCKFTEDGFLQALYLKALTPDDVIIAISHSGRAANTLEFVKIAKERGLQVITITSIVNAPIAKYSDLILYVTSMEQEYFSNSAAARISEIMVISILHSALIQRLGSLSIDNDKEIHTLYELKRVPPSR